MRKGKIIIWKLKCNCTFYEAFYYLRIITESMPLKLKFTNETKTWNSVVNWSNLCMREVSIVTSCCSLTKPAIINLRRAEERGSSSVSFLQQRVGAGNAKPHFWNIFLALNEVMYVPVLYLECAKRIAEINHTFSVNEKW